MKLGDLYAVMALIFSANFRVATTEENFKKINQNWLIKNETKENKKGHEMLAKAIKEDYEILQKDFENLKEFFEFEYYKLVSESDVENYFEKIKFVKSFKDLKSSHACNMLSFLAACFKINNNAKTHALLRNFAKDYLLQTLEALAINVQNNAKGSYYKALGYFLSDYCNMLRISLKIEK